MTDQPCAWYWVFNSVVSDRVPPMSITSLMNVVARAGSAAVSASVAAVSAMAGSMGNVLRKVFAFILIPFAGWTKASVSVWAALVTQELCISCSRLVLLVPRKTNQLQHLSNLSI